MFFIRLAFWLSLVVLLIPVNPEDLPQGSRPVSTMEMLGTAQTAVNDLSRFCERNPSACETGGEVLSQFGVKARTGARELYEFLDDRFGTDTAGDAQQSDPTLTGGIDG
jgi:hypothetical protein